MKILILSSLFVSSLLSFANAATLPSLPMANLSSQLIHTASIVFNDESEAMYGDLLDNQLHIDKVCEALKQIDVNNKPRAIFIDMDITVDIKQAACVAEVAEAKGLKITLDMDPNVLSKETRKKLSNISVGSASVASKTLPGYEHEAPKSKNVHWHNPLTRVSLVKPAVMPYSMPVYFLNLVNGLSEQDLDKVDITWARKVTLADFTEVNVPKIAIQDVIAGKTQFIANKYVFIGVDQDKYDAFSNPEGEIVNGVFIHQQFAAGYLALMNMTREIETPNDSMIIFGEFRGAL